MDGLKTNTEFEIVLNGRRTAIPAQSLAALVEREQLGGRRVATAVNGHFVPEAQRATTPLSPGDKVEIVHALGGG